MNEDTRTLIKWARNNASDEALDAYGNGDVDGGHFSNGMMAAFNVYLESDGDMAAVNKCSPTTNGPGPAFTAGYRKATRDLARLV